MFDFFEELEKIKNTMVYIDNAVIDKCPKCGSEKLSTVRLNMRGTGSDDKNGVYCEKCRTTFITK